MLRKCAAGGSVVVVVLPLISLMEDQVASLIRHLHWTTWTPSRSAIQTAHFCCSPALLNNATLFLLFGTDRHKKRQTLRYIRTDLVSWGRTRM